MARRTKRGKQKQAKAAQAKAPQAAAATPQPLPALASPLQASPCDTLDDTVVHPDDELTDKERAFVDAFFICGFNAAKAWRTLQVDASTSVASSTGWRMRHRPRVEAEISRRLEASKLQANEVLAILSDQARGNLGRYIDVDDKGSYRFDFEALREDGAERLLKKVKFGQGGTVTFEFYDAQAAAVQLARVHGLLKDKLEVTGNLHLEGLAALAEQVEAELRRDGGCDG